MMDAADFIARTRRLTFKWGEIDCCLWSANYVREATGIDPAADLRGCYSTAFGARQVLMAQGGMEAIARKRMHFLKPGRTIVVARWRKQTVAGLRIGNHLFLKTPGDVLMTAEFDMLAGWDI